VTTNSIDVGPCPYCGGISGVKVITGAPATVRAWSCRECGTRWAVCVVVPPAQLFLYRLTTTVVLQEVIALAPQTPGLSDDQLRARLAGLARMARPTVTDFRYTDEAPAGRRSSDATPASAPGGQPVPPSSPRWARCPVDQHLHLLPPDEAQAVSVQGHGRAGCGRLIPRAGLTIDGASVAGWCGSCLAVGTATRDVS
jgi:hypothetical protein